MLQRAVFHTKSNGKEEVGVADVLAAIFSEKQSPAVHALKRQMITRPGIVNYISAGLIPP